MSTVTAVDHLTELKNIKDELKRISAQVKEIRIPEKDLKRREKEIKELLRDYIDETGQGGMLFNGTLIFLQQTNKREKKKKTSAELDALNLLKSLGIDDCTGTLEQLLNALRGEKIKVKELKIKEVKKGSSKVQ